MAKAKLATVVSLDSTKFRSGLRAIQSGVNGFNRAFTRSMGQSVRAIGRLSRSLTQLDSARHLAVVTKAALKLSRTLATLSIKRFERGFTRSMNVSVRALTRLSRSLINLGSNRALNAVRVKAQRLASTLVKLTAGFAALGSAIVFKKILDAAARVEILDVAYTNLTGSVTVARRSLRELENAALRTGVSIEVQSDAVQKFLALGFDPDRAIRLQRSILDVAGSMGLTAFQAGQLGFAIAQVAAKGVVQMEELRQQISEKGVPVFEALAEKTGLFGIELQKAIRDGKIEAEVLLEIFENYEGPFARFRGGAEKLGKTFSGEFNRMREAVSQLFRDLGKPIITQFKRTFNVFFRFFRGLRTEARGLGEFLAKGFQRAAIVLETMLSLFRRGLLKDRFKNAIEYLKEALPLALKIAAQKAVPLMRDAFVSSLEIVGKLINTIFSKDFGNSIIEGIKGGLKQLSGMGDIIRSEMGPEFNKFVAALQAGLANIPEIASMLFNEIKSVGTTVENSLVAGANYFAAVAADVFNLTDLKAAFEAKLEETKMLQKVQDKQLEKARENLAGKLLVDFFKFIKTPKQLKESGVEKITEGQEQVAAALLSAAGQLTGLKFTDLKNSIEKNKVELKSIFVAIGQMFGFTVKDANVQKSQLDTQKKIAESAKKTAEREVKEGRIDARAKPASDRRSDSVKAAATAREVFFKGGGSSREEFLQEKLGRSKFEKEFPGLDFFKKPIDKKLTPIEEFKKIPTQKLFPPGGFSRPFEKELRDAQIPKREKAPDFARGIGKEVASGQGGLLEKLGNIAGSLEKLQLV